MALVVSRLATAQVRGCATPRLGSAASNALQALVGKDVSWVRQTNFSVFLNQTKVVSRLRNRNMIFVLVFCLEHLAQKFEYKKTKKELLLRPPVVLIHYQECRITVRILYGRMHILLKSVSTSVVNGRIPKCLYKYVLHYACQHHYKKECFRKC